nr:MAG TPA: hypothetical protein [Caudoviricetes sp.]
MFNILFLYCIYSVYVKKAVTLLHFKFNFKKRLFYAVF